MVSVLLDANVLFAAAYAPDGRMPLIFDLAAVGALFGTFVEGVEVVRPTEALRRLVEDPA